MIRRLRRSSFWVELGGTDGLAMSRTGFKHWRDKSMDKGVDLAIGIR
jgi:hypothetical protein